MPPRRVLVLLAAFVGSLAIDASNAFLLDIGVDPIYPPDNRLRLVTGLVTGIALAAALCHVTATTLWRRGDPHQATIVGVREVAVLVLLQAPFAAVVLSGWGLVFAPVTLLLVCSAAAVVGSLTLASVTMLRLRDGTYESFGELQGSATGSLLLGLAVMGAIAGGVSGPSRRSGSCP